MVVREFLNNIEVRSLNIEDFAVTIDFTKNIITENPDIQEVIFGYNSASPNDAYNIVKNWGGLEPLSYRIEAQYEGTTYLFFNGFADHLRARYEENVVKIDVFDESSFEYLQKLAESTTFDYLYFNGAIKDFDFVYLPYVKAKVPLPLDFYIVSFSTAILGLQIFKAIIELQQIISDLAGVFTTISAIAKLGLQIIYILGLITAVINNLINIARYVIEPVKYIPTMRPLRMMQIATEQIGFIFRSSILEGAYRDAVIVPEKRSLEIEENGLLGLLIPNGTDEKGFYKGSVNDLINDLYTIFNARLFINGNEIRLERRDYKPTAPIYQLSGVEYIDYERNADEFVRDLAVSWQTDLNDKNTIQNYNGTAIQVITEPTSSLVSRAYYLQFPLKSVRIPFAKGRAKISLSSLERTFNDFSNNTLNSLLSQINISISVALLTFNGIISVVNAVISAINVFLSDDNKINLVAKIPVWDNLIIVDIGIRNRIGMLEMSSDDVAVPKLVIIDPNNGNKIHPSNEILTSAQFIYSQFWQIDSFVPSDTNPTGNQYRRYRTPNHKIDISEYLKIKQNAYIYDEKGDEVEIEKFTYRLMQENGEIIFRKKELYLRDIKEQIYEINGK